MADISSRKVDHLDLTISGDVGFKTTTTLFECVKLVHDALPEISLDDLDLSSNVLGKRLRVPILIAGMTGGTERAERINLELAALADERGYAFGLGSQRAMLKRPDTRGTYEVRKAAPNVLLLGNIGGVQAAAMSTEAVRELTGAVGADALCVHLNPAMEVVQDEGDRDFRGVLDAISRLNQELGIPVIAKETGCGLSARVGKRLAAAGIRHVDVSGAGGTSWVAVEAERAKGALRTLGDRYREWGIPTAASVAMVARAGFKTIFATGGMMTGVDAAKAVALGASAAGMARPALQAFDRGGRAGAAAFFDQVEAELRTAMLLTGSRTLAELERAPRLILGELAEWLRQVSD
ncbi:MAG TPA: type 2 isopentenyl-diphosphate Delta-isomerase [Polyangiaceae bacterium]|jgi:isopentenyl-diphosphate delta-isomerase|nr:type 2 isopentenyl-diphosphate Delta-isomerase [Polyangiaceae bacterium]